VLELAYDNLDLAMKLIRKRQLKLRESELIDHLQVHLPNGKFLLRADEPERNGNRFVSRKRQRERQYRIEVDSSGIAARTRRGRPKRPVEQIDNDRVVPLLVVVNGRYGDHEIVRAIADLVRKDRLDLDGVQILMQ
jgi:hypothetical protein